MVPQPSGKAIDCNSVITGSNLVGTSTWGCGGMVDARDLKSLGSNTVRVQLPPSPPSIAPIAQLDRAFDYGSKGCGFKSYWARHLEIGMQLSLVEYLIWDQGVAGSNPVIPTIFYLKHGEVAQLARAFGSYPEGRGFESHPRYHFGPLAQLVRATGS